MSAQEYITCRELIDFLMDYLDGTLSPVQRHEFERHLAVCPPCIAYLDTYKCSLQLSKQALAAPDVPASATLPEDLVKAILASRERNA